VTVVGAPLLTAALATASLFVGVPAHAATARCAPISLAVSGGPKSFTTAFAPKSKAFNATSANFARAYAKACAGGLLKSGKLPDRLVLHNAPEANVASIYSNNGRTVLEYYFITPDGRRHVPDVAELHEAIYCSVRGATPQEEEESGRCLPD
jgi:hypothetical protein